MRCSRESHFYIFTSPALYLLALGFQIFPIGIINTLCNKHKVVTSLCAPNTEAWTLLPLSLWPVGTVHSSHPRVWEASSKILAKHLLKNSTAYLAVGHSP